MPVAQKLLLLTTGPDGTRGLDEANEHLRSGWRVAQVCPLGGGGAAAGFAGLVVLERSGLPAEAVVGQLEEELDEAIEGDGAGSDADALGLELPPEE